MPFIQLPEPIHSVRQLVKKSFIHSRSSVKLVALKDDEEEEDDVVDDDDDDDSYTHNLLVSILLFWSVHYY